MAVPIQSAENLAISSLPAAGQSRIAIGYRLPDLVGCTLHGEDPLSICRGVKPARCWRQDHANRPIVGEYFTKDVIAVLPDHLLVLVVRESLATVFSARLRVRIS